MTKKAVPQTYCLLFGGLLCYYLILNLRIAQGNLCHFILLFCIMLSPKWDRDIYAQ